MLDFTNHPPIDKHAIVGGCVRLALTTEPKRLHEEVAALPPGLWGTTAGRVGVHSAADALFLRGYAPAEGEKPIEDRPVLDRLPYFRWVLEQLIPAAPQRALLARLPAAATIPVHIDRSPYFSKTLRIHVPIETNENVWMLCADQAYQMLPGEVWALNNSAQHGVWNRHPSLSRTHLICDFLPTPGLNRLIAEGDSTRGRAIGEVEASFPPAAH
jgi:hypothetical protein